MLYPLLEGQHFKFIHMCKSFFISIVLILALMNCFSQNEQENQLNKKLDSLISERYKAVSPGCTILVAKNGEVFYKKAFGSADLELNVPMQPDMIFRIGSITKQYTAIAILQLVEQGKVSLQDSIQKFINDFPCKGHTITIENLLTHSSGIIDYQALDTKEANEKFYYRKDFEPKQVIDFFKNEPLGFIPGSKFSYSNSNYFLLGYIIEIISGKSYRDYLRQNIFDPAGLSNTYYGDYKEIIPNRVNGYTGNHGKYENADYVSMSIPYAAGAIMSNVEDMFKWHQALYSYKLIKKETLDKALTPFKLTDNSFSEYGYGWFIKTNDGSKSIEHSGGIDGFQSDEIYLPHENIFIAALYNSINDNATDMGFMVLTNDIAALAAEKIIQEEIKLDESILEQYTGVYELDKKHSGIVTLENGRLQLESSSGGLPKSPLFAESENKFRLKVPEAIIEFVRNADGQVIKFIIHVNGKDQVAMKIK